MERSLLTPFFVQLGNIYAVPIIHYNMETAAQVRSAFLELQPDCIAVELAETMQSQLIHAASRLPDISVIVAHGRQDHPIYYLCETCEGAFEALRSALEAQIPAYCIDLDIDGYPDLHDPLPDPYAIQRIGLKKYYESYQQATALSGKKAFPLDLEREMYMARRLKELSYSHDKIMFVCGMSHLQNILQFVGRNQFPKQEHAKRESVELCTISETSCREVLAEYGWISSHYEEKRQQNRLPLDRQRAIFSLYKAAAELYTKRTGNSFPGYHFRNLMKFVRNYALLHHQLMPDLYKIIAAAKGCVDHNYAYEVWNLATSYPELKNIDNLPVLDLSVEDVWKTSKKIRFHLKQPGRKGSSFQERRNDKSKYRFSPPGIFSICSYPPEDKIVEGFGDFLKKKGTQIATEEAARTIPFSTSLEDGLDLRETIRHWYERKLYVKVKGKPPGGVGSVVMIFDEDSNLDDPDFQEKYFWRTTWLGEHKQESDMAFYSTPIGRNLIGPGISRCEYGGFMMSSPPRRMRDVWNDPDYDGCRTKAEVLLVAAIDYAIQPLVVYVASKPPRSAIKSFAQRFGKKIVYLPIGQLSPVLLNKIRVFHVLDSHDKRAVADEYIF